MKSHGQLQVQMNFLMILPFRWHNVLKNFSYLLMEFVKGKNNVMYAMKS